MPGWVTETYTSYNQRLNKAQQVELIEISPIVRNKSINSSKAKELEAQKLIAAIKPNELVVLLDEKGKSFSTKKLAATIQNWQMQGKNIAIIIGGADGVSHEVKQIAQIKWSLSELTFPHPLVRIILIEQIYRAYSLIANHPYHRE